jgi:hypothetical protein
MVVTEARSQLSVDLWVSEARFKSHPKLEMTLAYDGFKPDPGIALSQK